MAPPFWPSAPSSPGAVALLAWAVPWRSATCEISCAMTPAISASDFDASIIPRLRNIGPPGRANALISFWLMMSNE